MAVTLVPHFLYVHVCFTINSIVIYFITYSHFMAEYLASHFIFYVQCKLQVIILLFILLVINVLCQ